MRLFLLSRQRAIAVGTSQQKSGSRASMMPTQFRLIVLFALLAVMAGQAGSSGRADSSRFVTVPALGVAWKDGSPIGGVHYIAIQLDDDLQAEGPRVWFSEIWRGSAVGDDWKEGVRRATIAAAAVLGQDPGRWTITVRNRSYSSFTEGASASGPVAIGIMAAWRGDTLRADTVLTGVVTTAGALTAVDALPAKLDGAAAGHMRTMLIPRGQARMADWDLYEQGRMRNVAVVEVGSLSDAYGLMVASPP
jgi:hypothetical protein